MRHKKSIMAVFSMGLLLSSVTTHATAEGIPFHLTFSGSGVTSPIDTNGDGIKATVTNLAGKSTLGKMTIQTLGEALPPLPQPLACPSTTVEIPALLLRGIARVEGTGELMFFEYTSGANCFDPLSGVLDFHGEGNWIGGTGRFVNLTGSFETTAAAMVLVSDPARQNFSSFSGEVTGTLILPK